MLVLLRRDALSSMLCLERVETAHAVAWKVTQVAGSTEEKKSVLARARALTRSKPYAIPSELELLHRLRRVERKAMTFVREYQDKDGNVRTYSAPDFKAAITAIRVQAEICGFIRQTPQFETRDIAADAMRRALSDPDLRALLLEQLRELEPGLLPPAASESKPRE